LAADGDGAGGLLRRMIPPASITPTLPPEFEELRAGIDRLRTLLENLVVRGLRACGAEELSQIQSFMEYLERTGAGHVASVLGDLHAKILADDRSAATALLTAQTSVRLLERLLTLRIVHSQFAMAQAGGDPAAVPARRDGADDVDEADEDEGG
jgi:hypothetical protein